jgi:hypothetical protein
MDPFLRENTLGARGERRREGHSEGVHALAVPALCMAVTRRDWATKAGPCVALTTGAEVTLGHGPHLNSLSQSLYKNIINSYILMKGRADFLRVILKLQFQPC